VVAEIASYLTVREPFIEHGLFHNLCFPLDDRSLKDCTR
jgi:hypothetical protein